MQNQDSYSNTWINKGNPTFQARIEKTENDILELSQNAVNLKSNYLELMELRHVLEKTQVFFTEVANCSSAPSHLVPIPVVWSVLTFCRRIKVRFFFCTNRKRRTTPSLVPSSPRRPRYRVPPAADALSKSPTRTGPADPRPDRSPCSAELDTPIFKVHELGDIYIKLSCTSYKENIRIENPHAFIGHHARILWRPRFHPIINWIIVEIGYVFHFAVVSLFGNILKLAFL